jgi:histidine triad (HIT) family protein
MAGMNKKECVFCKIVEGEEKSRKIYEDKDFLAILDIKPIRDGHILLIPKIHLPYIFHFNDELFISLLIKAKQLSSHLEEALHAERIGLFVSGISIPHTHLHLVPVYKQHDLIAESGKSVTNDELQAIQNEILKTFS